MFFQLDFSEASHDFVLADSRERILEVPRVQRPDSGRSHARSDCASPWTTRSSHETCEIALKSFAELKRFGRGIMTEEPKAEERTQQNQMCLIAHRWVIDLLCDGALFSAHSRASERATLTTTKSSNRPTDVRAQTDGEVATLLPVARLSGSFF